MEIQEALNKILKALHAGEGEVTLESCYSANGLGSSTERPRPIRFNEKAYLDSEYRTYGIIKGSEASFLRFRRYPYGPFENLEEAWHIPVGSFTLGAILQVHCYDIEPLLTEKGMELEHIEGYWLRDYGEERYRILTPEQRAKRLEFLFKNDELISVEFYYGEETFYFQGCSPDHAIFHDLFKIVNLNPQEITMPEEIINRF